MITSSFPIYFIKKIIWWLGNFFRKLWNPPDYIVFTLEGDYPQLPQVGGNPVIRLFRPSRLSLMELDDRIHRIAEDPRVKGVVFILRPLDMPLAKIDEVREMFGNLQKAGKRVITWSYTYDTAMYYLASAADTICLLPGGILSPIGIYQQYFYLADALAMVGIKADFLQTSPFKSAGDMFTRSDMSAEVQEMSNWLADATYKEILLKVAEGRNLDMEVVATFLDQTPLIDREAMNNGLVDALIGEEDLPNFLEVEGKPARLLTWEVSNKRILKRKLEKSGGSIAIIRIEGLIVDGHSSSPPLDIPIPVPIVFDERAGDISVVNTIRQVMADERALGVVVYVNSRGGSPTASESMRRALSKLADKKPLVVVMGPVAASGGYWVSTPGKTIVAQPTTMTGSIGALMGKFVDQGLLKKLSINLESISRGENVDIYSPEAPFSETEREHVGRYLKHTYDLFVDRVSESRGLDRDQVDAIGGGRVWTGKQAVENGLVDELGGLSLGLQKAQKMAGLVGRTHLQVYEAKKGYIPPKGNSALILKYGLESLKKIYGKVICICPWVTD